MTRRATCQPRPTLATGLTLVELLVSMVLVATLTAAGLTAYARSHVIWRAQTAEQRRQERAQYVFGTLEPDLQMAGYFGPARPEAPLQVSQVPAGARACGGEVIARLDIPVTTLRTLPAACVPRALLSAGSDVLVVRRASARIATPRAGRAQWLVTDDPRAGTLLWDGRVPATAAQPELRDLILRIYYVARSADGDAGMPALRVKNLTEVAGSAAFVDTEVMPGVESLEVELLPQVAPRSVRIALRVRADAADANAEDARRTLSVTRHFTVRNTLPAAS